MKNEIKLIKTEKDYKEALKLAYKLLYAQPDTPEGEMLDHIATLIEIYEKEHYPYIVSLWHINRNLVR